jgi:hypothetical protein
MAFPSVMRKMFTSLLEEHSPPCYNTWVIDSLPNLLVRSLSLSASERNAACQHHKGGTNVCRLEYVPGLTTQPNVYPGTSIPKRGL